MACSRAFAIACWSTPGIVVSLPGIARHFAVFLSPGGRTSDDTSAWSRLRRRVSGELAHVELLLFRKRARDARALEKSGVIGPDRGPATEIDGRHRGPVQDGIQVGV